MHGGGGLVVSSGSITQATLTNGDGNRVAVGCYWDATNARFHALEHLNNPA